MSVIPKNMGSQLEGVPLQFCVLNSVGCKTCQLISISYIAINNGYVLKLSTNSGGCHPILVVLIQQHATDKDRDKVEDVDQEYNEFDDDDDDDDDDDEYDEHGEHG